MGTPRSIPLDQLTLTAAQADGCCGGKGSAAVPEQDAPRLIQSRSLEQAPQQGTCGCGCGTR